MKTELSKYQSCLSPVWTVNKYTGVASRVPCKKCIYCLSKKRDSSVLCLNIQASSSRYCVFVTLTYDNRYLPTLRFEQTSSGLMMRRVIRSNRISYNTSQGALRTIDFFENDNSYYFYKPSLLSFNQAQMLLSKTHLHEYRVRGKVKVSYPWLKDLLPFCDFHDFSAFQKRLRQQIFKLDSNILKNENLHYYVVSEYGPQTFRPHFHALYFFDSPLLAEKFANLVNKSWRLGDSVSELVTGSASSYVAGYTNSIVSLPDFYRSHEELAPKARFSRHFAETPFVEAFRSLPKEDFIDRLVTNRFSIPINGKPINVTAPRSFIDRVFPRFSSDIHASFSLNFRIAQSFRNTFKLLYRFGGFDIDKFDIALSRRIFSIFKEVLSGRTCIPRIYFSELSFIVKTCRLMVDAETSPDKCILRLYRYFNLYKSFFSLWDISLDMDDYSYYSKLSYAVRMSMYYHQSLSSCRLKEQLHNLEEHSNSQYTSVYSWLLFYPDTPAGVYPLYGLKSADDYNFLLESSPLVSSLSASLEASLKEQVKHKELNDANDILIMNLNKDVYGN